MDRTLIKFFSKFTKDELSYILEFFDQPLEKNEKKMVKAMMATNAIVPIKR